MSHQKVARRGFAAILAASAIGLGLPVVASATPPTGLDSLLTSSSIRHEAASPFVGTWGGHGRRLIVRPDGTAQVNLASGASNYQAWDATWKPSGSGIAVTFTRLTENAGDLGGRAIHSGDVWIGSFKNVGGHTMLELSGLPGLDWCNPADAYNGLCGA